MTFGLPHLFWRLLAVVLGALWIVLVTVGFVFPYAHIARPYTIPNNAMSPALIAGDVVYSYELAYTGSKPRRGDIIVFSDRNIPALREKDDRDADYIKRVVGLPGDTISIHNSKLCVDGKPAPELAGRDYDTGGSLLTYEDETFTVPARKYFVLGDNPHHSSDSRYWGCVPEGDIRGRVVLRVLPPQRFGAIH